MQVENNTIVKVSLERSDVRVESLGGELVLFNNDNYRRFSSIAKGLLFTGVYLEFSSKCKPVITDLDGNSLEYSFVNKGLYVKYYKQVKFGAPFCIFYLVPHQPHPDFEEFFGRFILINKEK